MNEDFYAPTWYINRKGVRIDLFPIGEPKKSQAELDWEEGPELWDGMEFTDRYSALLANGIGGIDAEQGKFSAWDKLGPPVRDSLPAYIRERNKQREPAAVAAKLPPPREVDPRQMELF